MQTEIEAKFLDIHPDALQDALKKNSGRVLRLFQCQIGWEGDGNRGKEFHFSGENEIEKFSTANN